MGDVNADTEGRIANSVTNLQADIQKFGHHGSAPSSSSAFLSKVQPKSSIIEVGAGNSYGHPTAATLDRLAQVESAVYCSTTGFMGWLEKKNEMIELSRHRHAGSQPGLGTPEHLPGHNS